jgi:hypothetical protein
MSISERALTIVRVGRKRKLTPEQILAAALPRSMADLQVAHLPNWKRDKLQRVVESKARAAIPRAILRVAEVETVVVKVDSPLTRGDKDAAVRSLRGDSLAALRSRDQIDEAEFLAGRKWQRLLEQAQIGDIRAIDPTKEAVDGGRFPEPITDEQIKAFRELKAADKALGLEGGALVRDILGSRLSVTIAAARRGMSREAEIKYIGRRFRECLDTLANLWGLATRERTVD